MKESDLIQGYRRMPVERVVFVDPPAAVQETALCPGFRGRGCMTRIPVERYLCQFCRRSALAVVE